MNDNDRAVLEFVGRQGKSPEALARQFPDTDIDLLIRAGLVTLHRIEVRETHPPGAASTPDILVYVLTSRGADALGMDPSTLHAA